MASLKKSWMAFSHILLEPDLQCELQDSRVSGIADLTEPANRRAVTRIVLGPQSPSKATAGRAQP